MPTLDPSILREIGSYLEATGLSKQAKSLKRGLKDLEFDSKLAETFVKRFKGETSKPAEVDDASSSDLDSSDSESGSSDSSDSESSDSDASSSSSSSSDDSSDSESSDAGSISAEGASNHQQSLVSGSVAPQFSKAHGADPESDSSDPDSSDSDSSDSDSSDSDSADSSSADSDSSASDNSESENFGSDSSSSSDSGDSEPDDSSASVSGAAVSGEPGKVKSVQQPAVDPGDAGSKPVVKTEAVDTVNGPALRTTVSHKNNVRQYFSRIDQDAVSFEDSTLQDNKYKGAAGTWGERANDKLVRVRGKDFTKNKNKMKRGSYRGGSIIPGASGSYKFQD